MKKYMNIVAWILSFQFVSAAIGWLMKSPVDGWYTTLNRSSLTPPGYLFGLVWPVLYLMLALVGFYIWDAKKTAQLQKIKKVYIFQMALNWSWSLFFFNLRMVDIALMITGLMIASTTYLMFSLSSKERFAAVLLLPYLSWISFAFYLNAYISIHN